MLWAQLDDEARTTPALLKYITCGTTFTARVKPGACKSGTVTYPLDRHITIALHTLTTLLSRTHVRFVSQQTIPSNRELLVPSTTRHFPDALCNPPVFLPRTHSTSIIQPLAVLKHGYPPQTTQNLLALLPALHSGLQTHLMRRCHDARHRFRLIKLLFERHGP